MGKRRQEEIYTQPIKKKKKRKRRLSSQFYWMLLLLTSITTFLVFLNTPVFPLKWTLLVLAILVGILLLTGIFSSILSPRNRFQKFVNCSLAIILGLVSVLTPYYINKVTELFESALGNKVKINLYVLTDEYKANHADTFQNVITLPEVNSNGDFVNVDMKNYANAVYGTSIATDTVNQEYAVKELKNLCGTQIQTIDKSTLGEAVEAFYQNHTDILIMSESMASTISDIAGYENFESDTKVLYTIERTISDTSASDTVAVNMTTKPFTIFFGGNDQEGSLSLEGRTDVDMAVTVNPNTHQIVITSLPRDSYIPNPYYDGEYDKLTHLGLSGIDNTLKGLGEYIDEPIENYVLVNFTTFMQIVEALGGVTIENPYTFTAINGTTFHQGTINMPADIALLYCRERQNLPDGDFGRNMHQQLVMQAIIEKITSPEGILKFNDILDSIKGYFLTNVSSDSIYALVRKQLDENINWNIVRYSIQGETGSNYCASVSGQALSVVYPYDNQIEFVRNVINQVVEGEIVTQQELPEGEITTSYSSNRSYSNDYNDNDNYNNSNNYDYSNYSDESYNDSDSYNEPNPEPVYEESEEIPNNENSDLENEAENNNVENNDSDQEGE